MYQIHLIFDDKARREIITSSRYVRFRDERKPNKIDFFLAKVTLLDSSKSYKRHELVEKHFRYDCKGYGPSAP